MFIAPVLIMARVRTNEARGSQVRPQAAFVGPLAEAFRYAINHPTLGVLIILSIAPGAIGLSYIFMLPVAADELGIGAAGLGILMAASGIGGLVAGLSLEVVQRRVGHGRVVFGGLVGAAIGLTSFGLAPSVPLAIGALAIVGGSFLTFAASSVTLTQALSPPRLRARMVSLFATFYWGMMPIGALLVGLVAEATTARIAVALCGIGLAIAATAAFIARPQIATLAVGRDGLTLSGDLHGSGVERPTSGAQIAADRAAPTTVRAPDSLGR
jgi:predicted MFS family arabinose efflux permease